VAKRNCVPLRFNKDKNIAGKKCYCAFMKRHPEPSLRQPESTSIAQARGFSKSRGSEFFEVLEKLVDQNELDATRVFNADETPFYSAEESYKRYCTER
jgi:hypothetical protein